MSNFNEKLAVLTDAIEKELSATMNPSDVRETMTEVRAALSVQPLPEPETPVSIEMVAAGRTVWLSNPNAPPHVLLPIIYRAMDAVKPVPTVDEAQPVEVQIRKP